MIAQSSAVLFDILVNVAFIGVTPRSFIVFGPLLIQRYFKCYQ
jgi:hypothetical protein